MLFDEDTNSIVSKPQRRSRRIKAAEGENERTVNSKVTRKIFSTMSQQIGAEARYLSRFSKIKSQTGESIKNVDSARNLTEHLTHAKASLRSQEANTRALFGTAQEVIAGIDTLQQMLGHTFVKNMPLPSKEISESPGKQLGYVQLTMRFLQAGVVHFMEQMSEATDRIEQLEGLVKNLAEYDEELNIVGDMQTLDLDSLDSGPSNTKLVTESITKPLTPPASPVNDHKTGKEEKESKSKPSKRSK